MALWDRTPTIAEMIGWRDQLNGEWTSTDGSFNDKSFLDGLDEEQRVYSQDFLVWTPEGKEYLAAKTGSAPSDADAAIDSLRPPSNIRVRVKRRKDTQQEKDRARKLRLGAMGILDAWRKDYDPINEIVANQVLKRVGIARVMVDTTNWAPLPPELQDENAPVQAAGELVEAYDARKQEWDAERLRYEAEQRRKLPIVFEPRDPRFVRWREVRGRLVVVVESYLTTVLEALMEFGHLPEAQRILDPLKSTLNSDIRVDEVWFGKWRAIFLDDQSILGTGDQSESDGIVEHGYPEIPYALAPFRELPYSSPGQRYRGMFSNGGQLYRLESNALSMHLVMMAWNSWRTYVGHLLHGQDINVSPGQYIPVNKNAGEYLELIQGQPVPPELLGTVNTVQTFIQRNVVAQGPTTGEGTRSAQQVWAIQNARQAKLESPRANAERLVARCVGFAFQILEQVLKEPITLPVPGKDRTTGKDNGEVTLRPADIDGYYDGVQISFTRRIDPALIEQWKAGMGFSVNNFLPLEWIWDNFDVTDDVEELMDMMLDQETENLPFIKELVGLERIREMFGEDSWQFVETRKKILAERANPAPPGGMGQPTGGGGGQTPPALPNATGNPPGGQPAGGNGVSPVRPGQAPGRTQGFGMTTGPKPPQSPL